MLPTDAKARKNVPLYSGLIKYFPDALAAVAEVSRVGNEQHNPGSELHWDRSKSTDELDALTRHLFEAGGADKDGQRHSAKIAWRALASLQKEIEKNQQSTKPHSGLGFFLRDRAERAEQSEPRSTENVTGPGHKMQKTIYAVCIQSSDAESNFMVRLSYAGPFKSLDEAIDYAQARRRKNPDALYTLAAINPPTE